MNLYKDKNGFCLDSDNVCFDFVGDLFPKERDSVFKLDVTRSVPVPVIKPGDRLLLPVDEGIAITAEKKYAPGEFDCNCIRGSFCNRNGTMSMIIIQRENKYLLIGLDNGINSEYKAERKNGLYTLEITCHKECGVTYGIYDSLVDACKSYRNIKKDEFITLREKIRRNPEAQKLIGGGIFWVWNNNYDEVMYSDKDTDISPAVGKDLLSVADELHKSGVDNAMFGLFFNEDSPLSEELYKRYGYISTQYDNYNDVLNPEMLKIVPNNRVKNCDYTFRRMKDYSDGVQVQKDGRLSPAWELRGFDGKMYSQNTLCPLIASGRMKEEIPEVLKEFPFYKGRFIDVYGGGLSECYSKDHPLSREECLNVKNEAFKAVGDMGLIVGTEDGFEDIINNLVYTEGLHSPVHFRNPNSGRNHAHIYNKEQTEHILKNMLNPECRVPLWHLVYHENMLAFPYWGDSTEMSPEFLKKKILFACLYGCPPLYSFFVKDFEKLKDSIVSSYKTINAIHKKVAELPMTDFQVLRDDYKVQRSVFGDKYEVIVNFSEESYTYKNKLILPDDLLFEEI